MTETWLHHTLPWHQYNIVSFVFKLSNSLRRKEAVPPVTGITAADIRSGKQDLPKIA